MVISIFSFLYLIERGFKILTARVHRIDDITLSQRDDLAVQYMMGHCFSLLNS
jgi:hypothetical protein